MADQIDNAPRRAAGMGASERERELLREIHERLDGWIYDARGAAFEELFEGPDSLVSEEELLLLDRLDSRLSRERGRGLWGEDEYAIVGTGALDEENTPRVVCTTHPRVPEDAYPGEESLDDETRTTLDEALWEYCQRVVELAQQRLEEFAWSADATSTEE